MAQWYYSRDNKQKLGPFSTAQLKELAASGQLQPFDMVTRDGDRKWAAAASIKGLFAKGTSADRPASPPPHPPSPRQAPEPIRPDARVAGEPVRQGKRKSGRVAKVLAFLLLVLAGVEAAGLFLQKEGFDRRLAELDRQVQEGAKAEAWLDRRLAESEQQAQEAAKARAALEQRLTESDRQVQGGTKVKVALEQRLAESEQQSRQQAGKVASLEARLTESDQRVKETAAETGSLRKRLAESEQKSRDSAAAEAVSKRRLRLLAHANLSSYALDQHALRAPREVEESVASLAKYLTEPAESDREKVRAIFRWMTDRISYDIEGFLAKRRGDNSPAAVLKNRRCVCEGYARLFEALCKEVGVEVAFVSGQLKQLASRPEDKVQVGAHGWNAVKLGSQWHLVDVTVSAGYVEAGRFVKHFDEFAFLPPPDQLVFTHLPNEPKWQLLEHPVSATEFKKLVKVGQPVAHFPGASEELRRKLQDASFRGFVTVHARPEITVLIHKGPLAKHLRAGAKVLFRVESTDLAGVAVKNGDAWHQLTRKGNVFEGEVAVQKGALHVVGQIPQKGKVFWNILEYVVE